MDKKASTRKLKAAETKKRIFETAIALFKKHDFENVSVDTIVETAGVSKGSFYVYYKSKHELITEYVNSLDLDYAEFFSALPQDIEPSEMLMLVTGRIVDILTDIISYDFLKIIYEAQITHAIDTEKVLDYNRELYKIYRQIISLGVEQRAFRTDIEVENVANHFVMGIRGITYEWCIRYPSIDLKSEVLRHCSLLLQGICN